MNILILLLIICATEHLAQLSEQQCSEEFNIKVGDLKDPAKLHQIKEFLRKNFEEYSEDGLEIITTITTKNEVSAPPPFAPSVPATSTEITGEKPPPVGPRNMAQSIASYDSPASKRHSTTSRTEATTMDGKCEFTVGGRQTCFWTEVHNLLNVNFTAAQQICARKNSILAAIPDENVYSKLLKDINAKRWSNSSNGWYWIWIGMAYNISTRLPDIFPKPSGYGSSTRNDVNKRLSYVYTKVWKHSDAKYNARKFEYGYPTWTGHGVICQVKDECEIYANGQCFWTSISNGRKVNFTKAQEICKARNSTVAVIPSISAYNRIVANVRVKLSPNQFPAKIWTGIKIKRTTWEADPAAAFAKWARNEQTKDSDPPYVYIKVSKTFVLNDEEGGIFNGDSTSNLQGVLCQLAST